MTMNNFYKEHWYAAQTYVEYRDMIASLHKEGKTTGPLQSEAMLDYSLLNEQRMKRIDKTYIPSDELIGAWRQFANTHGILVITEAWCGDAAQSIPAIAKAAAAAGVQARFILRDEFPDLIEKHLTNGGKSIPIALLLDLNRFEVLATWGPRPMPAQQMVMDYKHASEPKPPYSEFVKDVQLWYAKDRQQTMEAEWLTWQNKLLMASS